MSEEHDDHVVDLAAERDRRHMDSVITVINGNTARRINTKLNGRQYYWLQYDNCKTCTLDFELVRDIHLKLLDGIPVAQIHRSIDLPEGIKPGYQSVLNHAHRHFSQGYKTGLLDAKLNDMQGMSIEEAANHPMEQVSSEAVARLVLSKSAAMFSQGLLEIKTSDLLTATKLVREIEQDDQGVDEARYFAQAMTLVLAEAQKTLPSDDFDAMIWRLQSNSDMQRILRKVAGQPEEDELPPAAHTVLESQAIEATASEPSPMSAIV